MLAAEGGQTKTASTEIRTADGLKSLENASGAASFKLMNDIETSETITLNKDGSNITLDLNGHKIKHTSQGQSLFNITGGATLTIKDTDPNKPSESVDSGKQLNDQGQDLNPNNYGKKAVLSYDNGIPSNLTYYVTQSSPSATDTTKTTETLYEHSVDIKGAIVACGGNENLKLIYINGGHFSLENGVLTQEKDCYVRNLVYAENESTVNMNGGYVCGGYCRYNGAGAGISVNNNSTLSISNGVIAGNCAPSGGGVYANGSAVKVTGGVISGNSTNSNGYGGGIMAEHDGSVTVSGGYITNNRYANFCGKDGYGCHGGAGLAAINGAHVTISDGQITGNYSGEAGGGVYVSDQWGNGSMAWLNITGGIIASNVSYRSEGAGIRVGQKVDAMICGTPDNNGTPGSKVYITNNWCMSRFDWGGGGVFVQGDSNNAPNAGRLFVYNSYISANTAGGYGGGVAVCPTGKTLVTNTEGTAIFGNSSAGDEHDGDDHPDHLNDPSKKHAYDSMKNTGNDVSPHLSGGGIGDTNKTEDRDAYKKEVFRKYGHADFFLAARDHNTPVAVVIGKMLGGGDAQYSGSIELKEAINIPANGVVGVKNSIGLTSGVEATDKAATDAQDNATTFITGNYSWDHGGGIMSNGDLYLGQPADAYVYPSLKATKELIDSQTGKKKPLTANEFTFKVYRKGSEDPFANGTFNRGACTEVGNAVGNDANGNITFNLGDQSAPSSSAGEITYYLVEDAGNDPYIKYDPAVYEIVGTLKDNVTELMSVPTLNDKYEFKPLSVHNYTLENTSVTKHSGDSTKSLGALKDDGQGYYSIVGPGGGKTFTNKYTSSFSWIPKATKVVEGGEMKVFTLQLAKDSKFKDIIGTAVTSGNENKQTHSFLDSNGKEIELTYSLSDIRNSSDPGDSTGGPSKTFKYYVREKNERSTYPHYEFDQSVYELTVVAKDDDAGITTNVTYTQIVDAEGNEIPENERESKPYGEDTSAGQSLPTFTNTYSTTLPLSGMSGVTLTYLAGAAVLCAAAAWMHIRRKANAKGGERRE